MNDKKIILIGPMGAGKSSIGRRLSKLLDLPFIDTDQAIRERAGVDIDFIFEKEGEAGFRQREERVLAELLTATRAVIATGGGIVLSARNREAVKLHGIVVFLETGVEWQLARTRLGTHRPLLDTPDPRERLEKLHAERIDLYRETADITVNTDGRRVAAVANSIADALGKFVNLEDRT
ncbi:MAG: shikimate kinase [Proteobacteria bacterium]|nr:shikimate kinase [Pseudomonadota bacterium]